MMKKVGVAILGFGDVGVATYQTLVNHREFYLKTQRVDLTVEMVYDKSAECLTAQGIPEENHANSIEEVIANPLVDIVVETMGGVDVARTFVSAALREGKTVVTCNKELICKHLQELEEIARRTGCGLYYGASCVGGVPVLRTLFDGVQANCIQKIMGVIDGANNDNGYSTAYQLSILSSVAFNTQIPYTAISREDAVGINANDVVYGKELGYAFKPLIIAKKSDKGIEARISPAFISFANPLASVSPCNNAVYMTGDTMEEIMLLGKGTGALPTASALVSDVIYAATHSEIKYSTFNQAPAKEINFIEDFESGYYLRLFATDEVGLLAKITSVFAKYKVSIVRIAQKNEGEGVALVIITSPMRETIVNKIVEKINELDTATVGACIRVEE